MFESEFVKRGRKVGLVHLKCGVRKRCGNSGLSGYDLFRQGKEASHTPHGDIMDD